MLWECKRDVRSEEKRKLNEYCIHWEETYIPVTAKSRGSRFEAKVSLAGYFAIPHLLMSFWCLVGLPHPSAQGNGWGLPGGKLRIIQAARPGTVKLTNVNSSTITSSMRAI